MHGASQFVLPVQQLSSLTPVRLLVASIANQLPQRPFKPQDYTFPFLLTGSAVNLSSGKIGRIPDSSFVVNARQEFLLSQFCSFEILEHNDPTIQ
jgi:hypothetical protein